VARAVNDPGVYLEKISCFSRLLRQQGVPAGPGDTRDAAKILTAVGLENREAVKTALRAVYAKSREEQLIYDRVFDGFFLSEEAMRRQAQEQMERERQEAENRQAAEQELEEIASQVSLTPQEQKSYTAMSGEARQRLMDFMEKYRGNMDRNPALYGEFIHSVFAKAILEQQMLQEDAGVGGAAVDPELGILYRDISQFEDSQIPQAVAAIQDVSRRINAELTAKVNHRGSRGKLDFRRTIRSSLETGGVTYRLRYRRKKPRRQHLVVLCDVSGSMVQFSEFALRFIQSLNRVSESSRVFLFSEALVEADAFRLRDMDRFREYVRQSGIYGRGTDLGTALEKLRDWKPGVLDASTILIILSDTKTVDTRRAVAALRDAQRLSGKVLWLNPIPESKWQYLRSVQTMAALTPMLPCSTLRELANACRRIGKL